MNDSELRKNTTQLKKKITTLAAKYGYSDYKFWDYFEYQHDEPSENESCACILTCDGQMLGHFDGYYGNDFTSSFNNACENAGFSYEKVDHGVIHFYHSDEYTDQQYKERLKWQWVTHLIQPEYSDLHDELFEFFEKNPERLYNIKPRQLELYAGEIFRNKGYNVIMGPGGNDGGIDLRIYQKTDIDQITTLVQVKKYKKTLPVRLDAVAALYGHVEAEKASKGLFITTSRYLPGTKSFADRLYKKITLTDSNDLSAWSAEIKAKIIYDKSQLVSDSSLLRLVRQITVGEHSERILIHTIQNGFVDCEFALLLKETKYGALVILLPAYILESFEPPYHSRGRKIPLINSNIVRHKSPDNILRVNLIKHDKSKAYSGRNKYFTPWDGEPFYFDLND